LSFIKQTLALKVVRFSSLKSRRVIDLKYYFLSIKNYQDMEELGCDGRFGSVNGAAQPPLQRRPLPVAERRLAQRLDGERLARGSQTQKRGHQLPRFGTPRPIPLQAESMKNSVKLPVKCGINNSKR